MLTLLYPLIRLIVAGLQALPLRAVARLGRWGGGLAYWIDGRHRRVAIKNLTLCFGPERTPEEIRALARENFRRIGECYACGLKTSIMTLDELGPHLTLVGAAPVADSAARKTAPASIVVAIGHFGNFELFSRAGALLPGLRMMTTYRGLRQPVLNRLFQSMRERSGCRYFERRTEAAELKAELNRPGFLLGLLVDQRVAKGGVVLPFFGRDCRTSVAPAVFARRYNAALYSAICYRVGLAQWRVELGEEIPTSHRGAQRPPEDIMRDVNAALEAAVRRDPANWFWVHDRWRMPKPKSPPVETEAAQPPVLP